MKPKKTRRVVLSFLAVASLAVIWIIRWNTSLTTRAFTVVSADIPEHFSGYRIAQISDLHNAEFGDGNQLLLRQLSDSKPDCIVITGDLIDSRRTNVAIALDFAEKAADIAPVYYVTGNHESRIAEYEQLEAGLTACGVTVLRNASTELTVHSQTIRLIGIDDPTFAQTDWLDDTEAMVVDRALKERIDHAGTYTILLSHRPELFEVYVSNQLDLIFSGHAHGGQFRLPFLGGVAAPNQGLFPQYDSGLYTQGNTNMIVSRGLGNSIVPFRINNRPEIVVVTLVKR